MTVGAVSRPSIGRRTVWWLAAHPVLTTFLLAATLQLLWLATLANSGGDIAAQDAWAEFARRYPRSAYNLAWYGGIHPVSYSVVSPYVMAVLGVRTTMVLSGTVASALVALIVVRSGVARPIWASVVAALAFFANAISGRTTFVLGAVFGLAALAVVFSWSEEWTHGSSTRRLVRRVLIATLAALATFGSPLAGLVVGIVAAALWLVRRRGDSLLLGVPPVIVVALSAWLFPFGGKQPMAWPSIILPLCLCLGVLLTAPRRWRIVRWSTVVYAAFVLFAWIVPTPIGTNIGRLSLVFGGVVVAAILTSGEVVAPRWWTRTTRLGAIITASMTLAASLIWQGATSTKDELHTAPASAWTYDTAPLLAELSSRHASLARVEVVPSASHREAAALAEYVNLARGWNRQADAERNPLFYDENAPITPDTYLDWLHRWAVGYVVLPPGQPDDAAVEESQLIDGGLPYLRLVWADADWRLYKVTDATPLADQPAQVETFGPAELELYLPRAADVLVRVPYSPWLALVDADGNPIAAPSAAQEGGEAINVEGCLARWKEPDAEGTDDVWTELRAPAAGIYRIAAPYTVHRGTACPDSDDQGTVE